MEVKYDLNNPKPVVINVTDDSALFSMRITVIHPNGDIQGRAGQFTFRGQFNISHATRLVYLSELSLRDTTHAPVIQGDFDSLLRSVVTGKQAKAVSEWLKPLLVRHIQANVTDADLLWAQYVSRFESVKRAEESVRFALKRLNDLTEDLDFQGIFNPKPAAQLKVGDVVCVNRTITESMIVVLGDYYYSPEFLIAEAGDLGVVQAIGECMGRPDLTVSVDFGGSIGDWFLNADWIAKVTV